MCCLKTFHASQTCFLNWKGTRHFQNRKGKNKHVCNYSLKAIDICYFRSFGLEFYKLIKLVGMSKSNFNLRHSTPLCDNSNKKRVKES